MFQDQESRTHQKYHVKYHTKGPNIANHAWVHDHSIDFANGMLIDKRYLPEPQNVRIMSYSSNGRSRQQL